MAKRSYAIRTPLTRSYLDVEIPLVSENGVGMKQPVQFRIILGWLASGMLCFFLVTRPLFSDGGILLQICFVILWLAMTLLLLKRDGSGTQQFMYLPVLLGYLPKNKRSVTVRRSSPAWVFQSLTGIAGIGGEAAADSSDGSTWDPALIIFTNGWVGYMFSVTGSASRLLFDDDKAAILDRAAKWQTKRTTDAQELVITVKSAQSVTLQIGAVEMRRRNLVDKGLMDEDLQALCDQEYTLLAGQVGKLHRSIHQYMIIMAPNYESLMDAKNIFYSEVENSSLMVKRASQLMDAQVIGKVFAQVFRGKESV